MVFFILFFVFICYSSVWLSLDSGTFCTIIVWFEFFVPSFSRFLELESYQSNVLSLSSGQSTWKLCKKTNSSKFSFNKEVISTLEFKFYDLSKSIWISYCAKCFKSFGEFKLNFSFIRVLAVKMTEEAGVFKGHIDRYNGIIIDTEANSINANLFPDQLKSM